MAAVGIGQDLVEQKGLAEGPEPASSQAPPTPVSMSAIEEAGPRIVSYTELLLVLRRISVPVLRIFWILGLRTPLVAALGPTFWTNVQLESAVKIDILCWLTCADGGRMNLHKTATKLLHCVSASCIGCIDEVTHDDLIVRVGSGLVFASKVCDD